MGHYIDKFQSKSLWVLWFYKKENAQDLERGRQGPLASGSARKKITVSWAPALCIDIVLQKQKAPLRPQQLK